MEMKLIVSRIEIIIAYFTARNESVSVEIKEWKKTCYLEVPQEPDQIFYKCNRI